MRNTVSVHRLHPSETEDEGIGYQFGGMRIIEFLLERDSEFMHGHYLGPRAIEASEEAPNKICFGISRDERGFPHVATINGLTLNQVCDLIRWSQSK